MKKIISTEHAPAAIGPYSQAVEAGGVLYISGQVPVNPADGTVPQDISEQTAQCLQNMDAILHQAGYNLGDVVKTTVLLDDMGNFDTMNATYAKFFERDAPARACYQVCRLPRGVKVEIEAIACKK